MQISTIRLITKDFQRSRAFMEALFSFTPIELDEIFSLYQVGETSIELVQEDEKNPTSTGGTIAYFKTENLEALIETVKRLGGSIYRGPLEIADANKTIVQVLDPSGMVVGFESEL